MLLLIPINFYDINERLNLFQSFQQPGCVNTTEIDIKKACRMNKPMKSLKYRAVGVAGGRISPSVSEADVTCPMETVKQEITILRTKIDRCNFKVSKAAES